MVAAIRRRVVYLRQNGTNGQKPLAIIFQKNKWMLVCSTNITKAHHDSVQITGPQVGFIPEENSAYSMRAINDMSLLLTHVDTNTIRLVGVWQSNVMLRYHHNLSQGFI